MHIGAVAFTVREGGDVDEEEESCGKLYVWQIGASQPYLVCDSDVHASTMQGSFATLLEVMVGVAYQCAGGVDACVAESRVIEPFWLGEAEESVAWDVHG